MYAVFGKAVKALDTAAVESGIKSLSLMERAADGIRRCAERVLGSLYGRKIVSFCGGGNNGGDGAAFCLMALEAGADVRCVLTADPERLAPDAAAFLKLFREKGGKFVLFDADDRETESAALGADLLIDAIYGIGFHSELQGRAKLAAKLMNRSNAPVISADLPSGAEADTALVSEDCVTADHTVTFTCLKPAHCVQPAKSFCGEVTVCDIGIPGELIDSLLQETSDNTVRLVDRGFLDEVIPVRRADTHKGHYGKVLVIGGSIGYTGAPFLAASAAFRTGSGLVYLAVPESIYAIEASRCNEIIAIPLDDVGGRFSAAAIENALSFSEKCDVCVIGPGLGRSEGSDRFAMGLISRAGCPVIVDADGINAVSENINVLLDRARNGGKTILTPHDVEFGRLGGDLSNGRIAGCSELSARLSSTVVLKGNTTVVSSPGGKVYVNTTGNPGMAKGGSGDVLAGVIASLVGQGIEISAAAAAGAYIHGAAGDLAAGLIGEYGMLPVDLIGEIPAVLKKYGPAAHRKKTGGGR